MSYGFTMHFKQVNSKVEAFEFAMKVMKTFSENAEEHIRNCHFQMPSYDLMASLNNDDLNKADELWIYSLFEYGFTYWENENLVGMFAERLPLSVAKMFDTSIHFQNSTDQDYDYETWGEDITFFNEMVEKIQNMPQEEIVKIILKQWHYDENNEDDIREVEESVSESTLYYYQSALYGEIFRILDLDRWMDDQEESDRYIRFQMSSITGGDEYFRLKTIMKVIRNELKEAFGE